MVIDPKLIDILACPQCKGELEYVQEGDESFLCHTCRLRFRVEDGIPNFLVDDAEPLDG